MKGYMMNFINKFTCILTCAMSLISYNCNAMHAQADKDAGLMASFVMQEQPSKKRKCEQEVLQGMTLTDLPWAVWPLITVHLSGRDMTQLAQTGRVFRDIFNFIRPHMLVPRIAHSLVHRFEKHLKYIHSRIPKNAMAQTEPHIVIHGCRVPLLELETAVANDIQSSIIDILASRELDPIEYVCSNAQGQPIVNLYEQEFNTVAVLQQLRSLGWSPMRMQVADESLTLDSFFNNPGGNCDYSDQPIVPSVNRLQVPELFLKSLNAEERLDYAPWVYVRMVDGNYQALLQRLEEIYAEQPGVGIWLQIIGATIPGEYDDIELRQEFVTALAKYPITALFIDDAKLSEGSAIFSVLKHLRILSISLSDAAIGNLFSAALCQLPELRAVQFAIDPSIEEVLLDFPKGLGDLKKLQYINMYNFRFNGLENLASLPQLRILKLISPEFTQLPETLCDLRNLSALYWGSLEDREEDHEMSMPGAFIPTRIADLNKLRGLKIQYYSNASFGLPRSIGQLESLRYLDLSGCAITDLPEELGLLTNLHVLDLDEVAMQERFIRTLHPLAIHEVEIICDNYFFDSLLLPLRNRVRQFQDVIEVTSFNLKVMHDQPNLDVPAEFRDYVAQITRNREFFAYLNDLLEYEQLPLHKKLEILLHTEGIQAVAHLLSDNQFQAVAKEFSVSLIFNCDALDN